MSDSGRRQPLPSPNHPADQATSFLSGGGEMGARMRAMDWAKTPLGPPASWPQSLRTSVSTCLNSRFPILIWWGPELVMLYNDAYRPILGTTKHPQALGAPGRMVWPEIWDIIGPMLEGVISRSGATWSEDQMLPLDRKGFVEECYFTFSYSPIRNETGDVGGIFTAVTETTGRVLGERRMRVLRELAARVVEARQPEEACRIATETLAKHTSDVPFALLYLLTPDGDEARLCGTVGLAPDTPASPAHVSLSADDAGNAAAGWPLAQTAREGRVETVSDLKARFGLLPGGPWEESPHTALVLPIIRPGQTGPYGLMVVGISPRLELDEVRV